MPSALERLKKASERSPIVKHGMTLKYELAGEGIKLIGHSPLYKHETIISWFVLENAVSDPLVVREKEMIKTLLQSESEANEAMGC